MRITLPTSDPQARCLFPKRTSLPTLSAPLHYAHHSLDIFTSNDDSSMKAAKLKAYADPGCQHPESSRGASRYRREHCKTSEHHSHCAGRPLSPFVGSFGRCIFERARASRALERGRVITGATAKQEQLFEEYGRITQMEPVCFGGRYGRMRYNIWLMHCYLRYALLDALHAAQTSANHDTLEDVGAGSHILHAETTSPTQNVLRFIRRLKVIETKDQIWLLPMQHQAPNDAMKHGRIFFAGGVMMTASASASAEEKIRATTPSRPYRLINADLVHIHPLLSLTPRHPPPYEVDKVRKHSKDMVEKFRPKSDHASRNPALRLLTV
ncbi:uncharacterized protein MYCFIDRAFT_180276 [Pseudocercospora fijiensis CIRAD86]|uniref:Uncharacterized protein n=1 Tax=Pseudocercospora fijiensis (strain CIRAD86) TaxID=383855 RepID=M2YH21_PSEFD|nr:uncharacterized protein MYCFIDRAFT_180276 [Pseudocercospora fijiensis CIRAD86]EME77120.1 hypothetical protein MYCFIDRAFT_180276 [Pseudocercospora fijiensis CIRAD86]